MTPEVYGGTKENFMQQNKSKVTTRFETYGVMQQAVDRFNAQLSVEVLDAIRHEPGTLSQIYDRLEGRYTRKQLVEALALLVNRSRLVSQNQVCECGNHKEVPYYITGPEPTGEPTPPAHVVEPSVIPISQEVSDGE